MPVNTEDREAMRKLDDASRQNAVGEQLKAIRVASASPGSIDHAAINGALDRIEALQNEKQAATGKQNPVSRPGGVGGASQNPSGFAATRPADPSLPPNPQVPA